MKFNVKVDGRIVSSFKTEQEAKRCADLWVNDFRLTDQVVTIEEVKE